MKRFYITLENSFGDFLLVEENEKIRFILSAPYDITNMEYKQTPLLMTLKEQLSEYFSGTRKEFSVPFYQPTTEFQKEVYDILKDVSFGYTVSYGDISFLMNKEGASRAVGNAVGKNDILILMPCHRVVGKNSIGGFSSGLELKRKLLKLEGCEWI